MSAPGSPSVPYLDWVAGLSTRVRRVEIEVQRGDDSPIEFPVLGPDGAPRTITGWALRGWVWESDQAGATLLHAWDTDDGSAVAEGSRAVLLVDDSRNWPWSRGYFEVELTYPSGATDVLVTGTVTVRGHPSGAGTLPNPVSDYYTRDETDAAIDERAGALVDAGVGPLSGRVHTLETAPPSAVDALARTEVAALDAALDDHVDSPTPHSAYDDIPSLVLLFENGIA